MAFAGGLGSFHCSKIFFASVLTFAVRLGRQRLQLPQRHLVFHARRADQAHHGLDGALAVVREEALVHVTDLFDVERAEAERPSLAVLARADADLLDGLEYVQDRAVVDRQKPGPGLQPGVCARVEDRAVVRRQDELRVLDAAVHRVEQRDEPVPGRRRVLQGRLALGVCPCLQLGAQEAGRVGLRVHLVVRRKQPALLGEEQEDDAHHHRDGAPVDLARRDTVGAQAGRAVLHSPGVGTADRVDQKFDRLTDLDAQGVGDLVARVQALLQQADEGLGLFVLEEAPAAQEGDEGADDVPLGGLVPADGVEDGRGRDAADRGPDQAPPAAVGEQAERDVVVAQEAGQAVCRTGRPVAAPVRSRCGGGAARYGHAQYADTLGVRVRLGGEVRSRLDQCEVGAQTGAVLGDVQRETVQDQVRYVLGLPLPQGQRVAPFKERAQDVRDPLVPAGRGVGLPVGVLGAQTGALVLVEGVELGPGVEQYRHGEEGARDLGEVEPLLVLGAAVERLGLGCGESSGSGGAGAHRRASFAGITKTTATGKRWERGSW
nr:hypothetical protein [Streptomyces sp. Termitarium-T10T-6]